MSHSQPTYFASKWTVQPKGIVTINRTAEAITCLSSPAPFRIRLESGTETTFEQGLTFRSEVTFHKVELINPGDAAIEVELAFARGDVRDARLVITRAVGTREQTEIRPVDFRPGALQSSGNNRVGLFNYRTLPAQEWTQIAGNNKMRRRLIVRVEEGVVWLRCGTDGRPGAAPFLIGAAGDVLSVPGGGFTYAEPKGSQSCEIVVHEEIHV